MSDAQPLKGIVLSKLFTLYSVYLFHAVLGKLDFKESNLKNCEIFSLSDVFQNVPKFYIILKTSILTSKT